MIGLSLAVSSIVLFIILGSSIFIYISNTNTDIKDLNMIIAITEGEEVNSDENFDGKPPMFDGFMSKKNDPKGALRRPMFITIEKDGIPIYYSNSMQQNVKNKVEQNNITNFEDDALQFSMYNKAKNGKESGSVSSEGSYYIYKKVAKDDYLVYYFLDTTMTHVFFKNTLNVGLVIFVLVMVYILFIGKKILNKALAPLEISIENQKRFTGDASHELRTPLMAMRSNVDILIEYEMDKDEQKNWLNNISNEIDRMTKLTNDLLVLSRSDTVIKEYYEFNVSDILSRLQNTFFSLCNIEISGGDFSFVGNSEEILQLLIIFVDNAIKYNDKPKDEKNVYVDAVKKDKNIILTIKDNGIGIDEDKYDDIFERFFREDKVRNGSQNGFGLGLSIAKNIIHNYNGKVSIESKKDVGTTFIITLTSKSKSHLGVKNNIID